MYITPLQSAILLMIKALLLITINRALSLEIPRFINKTNQQILDELLNHEIYDHHILPLPKTGVNLSILVLSLSSPDESSVKYEVEFLLNQIWYDPRVRFESNGNYKFLNALRHAPMLWMPDTYFIKHGEFKYPMDASTIRFDPVDMNLKIFPNGTIFYTTRRNMILTCEGNLKIFPFDSPKCSFAIESVSYEKDQLELKWSHEPAVRQSNSMKTLNAYMIRNVTGKCNDKHTWRGEYSCLSVLLVFTRDKSFYFSTVFVPGMVLVTSSFISFWLDVNAVPARVMIGVTTMLNYCTTTNSFRSSLPVVQNLTAMNQWDGVCIFFIYASMIEFIIVNYLYRKMHHYSSRPNSGDRQSSSGHSDCIQIFRNQNNGRKSAETAFNQCDNAPLSQTRDEVEVRAPLVGGDDPSILSYTQSNHKPQQLQHSSATQTHLNIHPATSASTSFHDDDRIRAAASVFSWLRRPQIFRSTELNSRARLAKSIDHISKTVFTLSFGLFSFFFFLTYAVIKPAQLEDWIEDWFEIEDKN